MTKNIFLFISICSLLIGCKSDKQSNSNNEIQPKFQNKAHELVYAMVQKVGAYNKLYDKKSVEYTYTYETPDGKKDVSNEKYIFEGELSYGKYSSHERTLPQLEGIIEQGYDGKNYWLKNNGKIISNEQYLKRVAFNRPTNFYWFAMMQKLLDPGLNYLYLKEETINNQKYDVVKITFKPTNGKPTDIYQLYINQKTLLVDQFLFTVADFGKMEIPNLMKLEYEKIDGILIPTKRKYKKSTWNADVNQKPWIHVTWSHIKFDTGITKEDFKI